MLDDWISGIDKNEIVGTFDLVDHDTLLQQLSHYGLHNNDLDWFKYYLNSRTLTQTATRMSDTKMK